jgi:hypothetical protein
MGIMGIDETEKPRFLWKLCDCLEIMIPIKTKIIMIKWNSITNRHMIKLYLGSLIRVHYPEIVGICY